MLKLGLGYTATIEDLETRHFLGDFLHPTLMDAANDLEYSILRLQYTSEMLLNRYGRLSSERHVEIQNLGEAAMQNYAMFASLARASRSYCIGLRYSVYETLAAGCLVQEFSRKILKMALDIKHNRSDATNDLLHKTISGNLLKRHRNQSITIPSVLNSGILQKKKKNYQINNSK